MCTNKHTHTHTHLHTMTILSWACEHFHGHTGTLLHVKTPQNKNICAHTYWHRHHVKGMQTQLYVRNIPSLSLFLSLSHTTKTDKEHPVPSTGILSLTQRNIVMHTHPFSHTNAWTHPHFSYMDTHEHTLTHRNKFTQTPTPTHSETHPHTHTRFLTNFLALELFG